MWRGRAAVVGGGRHLDLLVLGWGRLWDRGVGHGLRDIETTMEASDHENQHSPARRRKGACLRVVRPPGGPLVLSTDHTLCSLQLGAGKASERALL